MFSGYRKQIYLIAVAGFFGVTSAHAQLNKVFGTVFDEILIERLILTPAPHRSHFIPAAQLANSAITPALNNFIANNIASFPMGATATNMAFYIASGRPVGTTKSRGPIFAETAETLGKGMLNFSLNYSYLSMNELRGLPAKNIAFAFNHMDITDDHTVGDHVAESDVINVFLNMAVNASIAAFTTSLGVSDNLDLGVAIPFIRTDLSGRAKAVINSVTFRNLGEAVHRFNDDGANPVLETIVPFEESVAGIGDVMFRLKYNFLREWNINSAALCEVRIPTGDEDNFLGTGKTNIKFSLILAKSLGNFSPHLNLGFDQRAARWDSDEIEFTAGFEQKLTEGINFSATIMGEYDLEGAKTINFPGGITVFDHAGNDVKPYELKRSNVPDRDNDNTLNASLGLRAALSDRFLFLGNIMLPLNDGGLRSTFIPTIGMTLSL